MSVILFFVSLNQCARVKYMHVEYIMVLYYYILYYILYCACLRLCKKNWKRCKKFLRPRVRGKLAEMQKNRGTVVLMNAKIIFMTVNACLRTVRLRTGIHVHI